MKKLIQILLALFLLGQLSCMNSVKRLKKGFNSYPVQSETTTIFISKHEVTNKEFNTYLGFLQKNNPEQYQQDLNDTLKWTQRIDEEYFEIYQRNYRWHPRFNNQPTVNVSLQAAKNYCSWLTKKIAKKNKNITFRLPTKDELLSLINQNIQKCNSNYHADYDSNFCGNLKYNDDVGKAKREIDGFLPMGEVTIFKQSNSYHCIIGNVSELTESGEALGGNWDTFPSEINKPLNYSYPDPRIGFRVVMEIIK